jgi:hypothetical protein
VTVFVLRTPGLLVKLGVFYYLRGARGSGACGVGVL